MAAASTVRFPPCSKRIYERLQGRNILFDSEFYHQRFFKSWKVTDFVRAPARILPALIESERAMPNNYIASLRLAQMEIAANTTKKRSRPVIVV
jgi:hypothetical protein